MFHNSVLYKYIPRWLAVLRSIRRDVRTPKSLTDKCPYSTGEIGGFDYFTEVLTATITIC